MSYSSHVTSVFPSQKPFILTVRDAPGAVGSATASVPDRTRTISNLIRLPGIVSTDALGLSGAAHAGRGAAGRQRTQANRNRRRMGRCRESRHTREAASDPPHTLVSSRVAMTRFHI